MDDVAVLNHVFLALQTPATRVFGTLLAVIGDEVVVADHLGADKTLLEIRMNDSCGLRRGGADLNRPGTDLLLPGGEVGLQVQ